MRPNNIRAVFLIIPILISCVLVSILYKEKVGSLFLWGIILIIMVVFIFIHFSSFVNIGKFQTKGEINKYRGKILYNNESFTIITYSRDFIINWNTIEAIFFINTPPLDGEYHNKEFRIFLSREPLILNKRKLKWYDKILPKPKKEEYPMVKIDDYYNIDFDTFYPSIEKFLISEKIPSKFLNGKFGNEVDYIQKGNTIIDFLSKYSLITMDFHKIFDKGSHVDDGTLKEYRNKCKSNINI